MERPRLHGENPEIRATYTFPFPGSLGWVGVLAIVLGYDLWAEMSNPPKPTMSATLGYYSTRPVIGPVIIGLAMAIFYHLGIEVHKEHRRNSLSLYGSLDITSE